MSAVGHTGPRGAVAQLVERIHGMDEVARSIRVGSTLTSSGVTCAVVPTRPWRRTWTWPRGARTKGDTWTRPPAGLHGVHTPRKAVELNATCPNATCPKAQLG